MNETENTLSVPGAHIYYKTQGTGPVLLVLQGGAGDAEGSDNLARHLVGHYTVVSYDRRGLSRSTLDAGADIGDLDMHADDAHRLLAALTTSPAFVLGSSIGALIGLDLVARYPDQIRTLVAHEPPVTELLPEDERPKAVRAQTDVEETYRREGVAAAMGKFLALSGVNFDDREPEVVLPRPNGERAAIMAANMGFFLTHDAPAAHRYTLDLDALQAVSARIVAAAGETSRESMPHRAARALAGRLNARFVEFPGGHTGYVLRPAGFAAKLRCVLNGLPAGAGSREE